MGGLANFPEEAWIWETNRSEEMITRREHKEGEVFALTLAILFGLLESEL